MDAEQFDRITRTVSRVASRRQVLRTVSAAIGLLGLLGTRTRPAAAHRGTPRHDMGCVYGQDSWPPVGGLPPLDRISALSCLPAVGEGSRVKEAAHRRLIPLAVRTAGVDIAVAAASNMTNSACGSPTASRSTWSSGMSGSCCPATTRVGTRISPSRSCTSKSVANCSNTRPDARVPDRADD